jgi:hypothetical protein
MPCHFWGSRSPGLAFSILGKQGKGQGRGGLRSATAQVSEIFLVLEATVLVLAEQREADGGQGVGLEELEALFKGVVDLDLAGAVEHDDAAGSVECRLV